MANAKELLKTILGSFVGKAGLSLFLVLGAISVMVTTTFPSDFGKQVWNNPTYWADYPKTAAPIWTSWFDSDKTQHQVLDSTSESIVVNYENSKTSEYQFTVNVSAKSDPTFLSFSLSNIQFQDESPIIRVFIEQDDQRISLWRHVVPGRMQNEQAPISRYANQAFRVQMTSDFAVERSVKEFLNELRRSGQDEFTAIVRIDFSSSQDSVAEVRFVAGGEVFGWLGTDNVGRDISQGILAGLPIALLIGLVVAFFVTLIGAFVGTISAYYGGKVDMFTQRTIDVITMVPTLPIVIFLVFAFGANLLYIMIFLIAFGWTGLAIQIRPWIMQLREEGFIPLVQAKGYSSRRIIAFHLLPQTLPFLFAAFIFAMPSAILSEAGLSFLGLGDPSLPTWGQMLQQGFQTGAIYLGYWWWILPPGIAIVIAALSPALMSMALESRAEPRLRKG